MSLGLLDLITSPDPAQRDRSLDDVCAQAALAELLAECEALDTFRRTSQNLYERVRALFFLYAIHRFHLPTRPELTTSQPGSYRVVVANAAGSVTSAAVTVTVVGAPVPASITAQPALASITAGGLATFTVQAAGTDLRYQWQLVTGAAASDIPGADSSSYSTSTAGTYRMRISNAAGSVTSSTATITVR
mgnify:CR=1 FL=1